MHNSPNLSRSWQITEIGSGTVQRKEERVELALTPFEHGYSDAQITDYLPTQRNFSLRPPLRLSLTAYSPTPVLDLKGTGGFGFWNHPFAPNERAFRLPQALWFFFSSAESNLALAQGVAGQGWKAASFNAQRWQFYSLLPTAPLAFPLMRIPILYRHLWRIGQAAIGVQETALALQLLSAKHHYVLEWQNERARFFVDDEWVLEVTQGLPQKALGFIAWLDNQYAIVTPQGRFGWGLVPVLQNQSLILENIHIELG